MIGTTPLPYRREGGVGLLGYIVGIRGGKLGM